MVYLYTTHDEDYAPEGMAGFRMKEWLLYTSTDMVNWTDHGTIANLYNFKWADPAVSGWGGFDNSGGVARSPHPDFRIAGALRLQSKDYYTMHNCN